MEKFEKYLKPAVVLFFVVLSAVVWYAVFYFEKHQNLIVTFFDVGQGDAIFIEQGLNQILIDGGPGNSVLNKLGRAMPFWDRSIDLLILTHPHADHLDGLLEVLKRYKVDIVLESGAEHSTPEYKEWRKLLKNKNTRVFTAKSGKKVNVGDGAELDILSPFEDYSGKSLKNPHDSNVVSRLKYGQISFLLMGDAEKSLEYRLLFEFLKSSFLNLKSDVLKIGHHGSKTSSSEEFLKVVSPEISVIQVGRKNRYGHPHQEVLDRLTASGIKVFRNDLDGDITFSSDGLNIFRK